MLTIKKAEFVKSLYDCRNMQMPSVPQVALAGRSNVGKSTFVNTVCMRKSLARTSAQPGKTRSVNFYLVNEDELYLVDLPGYGYAEVSRGEKEKWGDMMDGYFESASGLIRHLFLLLDIRREPNDNDRQMAWYAQNYAIPCTIIATKCDKLSKAQQAKAAAGLSDAVGMTFRTHTICFSSLSGQGRDEALSILGDIAKSK